MSNAAVFFTCVSIYQTALCFCLHRPCNTELTGQDSPSAPGRRSISTLLLSPIILLPLFLHFFILSILPSYPPSFLLPSASFFVCILTTNILLLFNLCPRLTHWSTPLCQLMFPAISSHHTYTYTYSFAATRQSVEQQKDVADRATDAMNVLMSICLGTYATSFHITSHHVKPCNLCRWVGLSFPELHGIRLFPISTAL